MKQLMFIIIVIVFDKLHNCGYHSMEFEHSRMLTKCFNMAIVCKSLPKYGHPYIEFYISCTPSERDCS